MLWLAEVACNHGDVGQHQGRCGQTEAFHIHGAMEISGQRWQMKGEMHLFSRPSPSESFYSHCKAPHFSSVPLMCRRRVRTTRISSLPHDNYVWAKTLAPVLCMGHAMKTLDQGTHINITSA
jgi:hypothetical protein